MDISFLFSLGILSTLLEVHLNDYNLSNMHVALCFNIETFTYFCLAMTAGYIFKNIDERIPMIIGTLAFTVGYLMFGPWELIFPNHLYIILISLPLFKLWSYYDFTNYFPILN